MPRTDTPSGGGTEIHQRLDRGLGFFQRVMFERVGQREEKDEDAPLGPAAEDGRANRGEGHEKIDIQAPFEEPFDALFSGNPPPGEIPQYEK